MIISSDSYSVDNQRTRQQRGPLVHVQIGPGQFRKMYEADAIAAGLLGGKKSQPAAENKMARPVENKAAPAPEPVEDEAQADFTTISGVGPATARAITAAGIMTFDELRKADLSQIVSGAAVGAIEAWKDSQAS
jgi:hypothetical protein